MIKEVVSIGSNETTFFSFYPNPTIDNLFIATNDHTLLPAKVNLYNVTGQLIQSWHVAEKKKSISLENISAGVYFLQLNTNTQKVTKKIIKK